LDPNPDHDPAVHGKLHLNFKGFFLNIVKMFFLTLIRMERKLLFLTGRVLKIRGIRIQIQILDPNPDPDLYPQLEKMLDPDPH
jgi:hypothetical protein